jgi:type IV conjugative transfer system coupling protein TraD
MSLTKNFTQGGQVTLHNLRMIRQVLSVTLGTTLIISLLFFGFKTWQDHTPYQRQITLTYLVAQLKTGIPFGDISKQTQTFVYEDGKKQKVRSIDILRDPWMKNQMGDVEDMLIINLILSFLLFLATFVGFISFWIWRGKARMRKEILSGSQEVPLNKLIRMIKKDKMDSDLMLGDLPLIKGSEIKHILFAGTTGTGKTTAFNYLLQQIRAKGQKIVIVDTTGTFVQIFYDPKTDIILNPFDMRSKNWDMWAECEDRPQATSLAASLIPENTGDPLWHNAARTLFVETFLKLKKYQNPSMKVFLDYASYKPLSQIQKFYAGTPAASLVDAKMDRTAGAVRLNLATYINTLNLVEDPHDSFSIREWMRDESKSGCLFLFTTADYRDTLEPLLTTWFNICVKSLKSLPRNKKDRRVWFCIDELASLSKVKGLPDALYEIRNYGGCVVTGIQNISQLDDIYGHHARKTMISLYNTKLLFRSPDSETAQSLSKLIGEQEILEHKEGISFGAHQMRDGVSLSEHTQTKPIIPYTEIMNLPDLSAYIKLPGDYPVAKIKLEPINIPEKNELFIKKPVLEEQKLIWNESEFM